MLMKYHPNVQRYRASYRAGAWAWAWAGATKQSLPPPRPISIDHRPLTTEQKLLIALFQGDDTALPVLKDCLEEKGMNMVPLKVGEKYLIETARWYYCVEVIEKGTLWTLVRGAMVHNITDVTKALTTGKFAQGSEISPLPNERLIMDWCIMGADQWFHELPMKRTHEEQP